MSNEAINLSVLLIALMIVFLNMADVPWPYLLALFLIEAALAAVVVIRFVVDR